MSSSWTIAHRLRWTMNQVRRNGPQALWWEVKHRLSPAKRAAQRRIVAEGDRFDTEHGYRTAGVIGLDIAGSTDGANHYQPVPVDALRATLGALDIASDSATLVDLGSGMGRAVLIAAEMPFLRIIGVEFARELHEIALSNLQRRNELYGVDSRISFVHGDAAALPVPDGPVVYFLCNSFGPPVLDHVLDNIRASLKSSPRRIRILCFNVPFRAEIEAAGFVWRDVSGVPAWAICEPNATT